MKKSLSLIVLILLFVANMAWAERAREWFMEGVKAHSAMNYDKAIECFKEAIAINPNEAGTHCVLGVVYQKKGMLDDAIFELKKAIAINPEHDWAHGFLALVYADKGMYDEAISELEESIAINLIFHEILESLSITVNPVFHKLLGHVYLKKEMFDKAIEEFKKAIESYPNDVEIHTNLGAAYSNKGMLDEAISEYRKVLAIDPNYAEAHFNLGDALNSLSADHFFKAGLLYLEKGDREAALKAYENLKLTNSKEQERALFEKLNPDLKKKKIESSK